MQPCVASHDVSTVIFVCPYGCAGRASTARRGTLRAPIARLVMLAHLLRNRQIRSATCVRKCQPSVGLSNVGTYPGFAGLLPRLVCRRAGTFSLAGATSCSPCAAGYNCPAGSTSATPPSAICPAGKYSLAGATGTCVNACDDCSNEQQACRRCLLLRMMACLSASLLSQAAPPAIRPLEVGVPLGRPLRLVYSGMLLT